ncbi:MAG TPA: phosphate ABC transporter permease subunit PstC [Acidimicrobiales bacterium]|nr:phosphate ABC transporter permease subunit PstC [Acidimicrobiales bacterium]
MAAAADNPERALTTSGQGTAADRTFRFIALAAGLMVLFILGAIAVSTTQKAWPAFAKAGLSYVFSDHWDPNAAKFGALAFIYGTFVVSIIAVVVAVPVSVGIALFVTEVAPRRVRGAITTVMDLLAAVPSVVFGLWGFLVLRPQLKDLYNWIADHVSSVPVLHTIFGPSLSGQSFMTAGLIVALMIVPIITSITREVFLTVPRNDKDGALALGATRWEMIKGVVLPHSSGGITGAVMLGLGRAMGETIAIALVIGASPQIVGNLFAQGEAMPSVIARNLNESSGDYQAALIGLGVTLFVLTIAINIAARRLVSTFDRALKGA